MHLFFTDEEKEWMHLDRFGLPLKSKCPADIKKSIDKKKKILSDQMPSILKGDRR